MIRVLLVEDNPADARLVREMLADAEGALFSLTHVPDLEKGIEALARDHFDAVLLDLGLPDALGLQAVDPVRKAAPDVPIVVLSGRQDESLAIQAVQSGAQDYLIKGRDTGEMIARSIRYAIERTRSGLYINHLAHHDALTNLPNRRLFLDRLEQALARTRRDNRILALLFLDLDQFKHVNDTHGHAEGDRLLRMVADRLRGCVRESDTVARLGGDEFTLILPEAARIEDVLRFAEKVFDTLAVPFPLCGREIFVTASMGISVYPADGQDCETLLKTADAAMYRAKRHGGNIHEFYVPATYARASERQTLVNELRHALARDQFTLHYQPLVDLRGGTVIGIEALLRWLHPTLGLVGPAQFLDPAQATGLIVPIDDWVMDRALGQVRAWRDEGLPRLRISLNASGRALQDRAFPERVSRALFRHQVDPGSLTIEVTEAGVARGAAPAETLRNLRERGVHLALDDFGTGPSSLSRLTQLPFDGLKIDGLFIRDVPSNRVVADAVGAMISMARGLHLEVVAEGVETADQVAFLRRKSCDTTQGFYFSRPLPAPAMTELLRGGLRWGQT